MGGVPTRTETHHGEKFGLRGATLRAYPPVCPDANHHQREMLLSGRSAKSDSQADVIGFRLDKRGSATK